MIEILDLVWASTTFSFQIPSLTTLILLVFWICNESDRLYFRKHGVYLVPLSLFGIFFNGGGLLVTCVLLYYWSNDRVDQLSTPKKVRKITSVHGDLHERFSIHPGQR